MSDDFMPLDGWDHVELWVGNAKQAAYYYEHAFGFRCTAYAGPETGVRDRASYVLEQNEIRLVISSSLRGGHEIGDFAGLHGDGVKDISLRVPDAYEAYRQAVQRGARGIAEPKEVEDEFGKVALATIATYGDVVHTFVDRQGYEGAYLPGYVAREPSAEPGVGLLALDHIVGNVELGRMLALHRELRDEGHSNVGVVLQAYLRRTLDDVPGLANVRICKGIYVEPPELAFDEFEAVRATYVQCLETLVAQGTYVGIATHDEYLIGEALRIIGEAALPPDRYEFQMLLGVRPDRADELIAAGHRLRVYVPYGDDWYEYSVRRLQENPKIAGYVARDLAARTLLRR